MADFQNLDLGRIIQTAEAIKGMRREAENDRIRNMYMGEQVQQMQANRTANAAASQAAGQKLDWQRLASAASSIEAAPNPKALVESQFSEFARNYEVKHGAGSWAALSDDQVKADASGLKAHALAQLGEQPTSGDGKRIGVFQPGDYTPESFAKFQNSGNAADLVRYSAPRAPAKVPATSGFDDPQVQALQAAFVAAGYSPPAGFRAKEQQLAMYQGLLKKYDGLSPDDIAHLAASNSIDFKSVGKATQTAASMGGRVEVANNELRGFIPIAKDASANVDRGSFVPFNRLKQAGQASISDPNLKRLFVATQTVLNAYDVLAARGGTDKDKRAENHRILENADSPEAYNAALDMITREGEAAGKATRDAMRAGAFGYPSGATNNAADINKPLSPEEAA